MGGTVPDSSPGDAPVARLRLLIVDDQPVIRRGLALMMGAEADIDVVGQAADGMQALAMTEALRPDVVVMDLQMPELDGVAATRTITARHPDVRVVVLTTFDDDDRVFDAIRAGAEAYLLKDADVAEVLDTIRAVRCGESRLSPAVARKVMEQFRRLADPAPADTEALNEREARILALLAQGQPNKRIAAAVNLAEGTVKNYVSRIMAKLHANSRAELVARARQRG